MKDWTGCKSAQHFCSELITAVWKQLKPSQIPMVGLNSLQQKTNSHPICQVSAQQTIRKLIMTWAKWIQMCLMIYDLEAWEYLFTHTHKKRNSTEWDMQKARMKSSITSHLLPLVTLEPTCQTYIWPTWLILPKKDLYSVESHILSWYCPCQNFQISGDFLWSTPNNEMM